MKSRETVKNTMTMANNSAFPSLRMTKSFKALIFIAAQVQKTLVPGSVHSIPMSLLNGLLNFRINSKDTAKILENLEKVKVDWAAYNKDWSGFSHVVSSCRYDSKKDTITYSFDPLFVQEFTDKKTPFKNIPISLLMSFRSNYALKLYELAYQYYDPKRREGKTPLFDYGELRTLFNIDDGKYESRGHFFDKVINKPLKEIHEITEYIVECHHNFRKGGMRRYWFTVKLDPQAKFDFSRIEQLEDSSTIDKEEMARMETENQERAQRFLDFWGAEYKLFIKRALTEAEKEIWVAPLLADTPSLSTFAELWIVDNFLKPTESKRAEYFGSEASFL